MADLKEHFGKYTYSLSGGELDEEVDTTLKKLQLAVLRGVT